MVLEEEGSAEEVLEEGDSEAVHALHLDLTVGDLVEDLSVGPEQEERYLTREPLVIDLIEDLTVMDIIDHTEDTGDGITDIHGTAGGGIIRGFGGIIIDHGITHQFTLEGVLS